MGIYIILIFLILILYVILKDKKQGKKAYCFIIGGCFILLAGLRHESMGLSDTEVYYKVFFNRILNNDFNYVLSLKDKLFQIFTYIYTRIWGDNFQFYILLTSIPYIAAISFLIYKYSKKMWLSFIIFLCIHYFEISFTLIRQVNGMAFLILAFCYLVENRKKEFLIFVLIGSCFHTICILFLIILPLREIKLEKWMLYISAVALIIFLFWSNEVVEIAKMFFTSERFARYSDANKIQTKNRVFFLMNCTFFVAEILNYKRVCNEESRRLAFWCSLICLLISPLTVALGEASRIAYLYGFVHIIILPDSIELIKKGSQKAFCEFLVLILFTNYFLFFLGPQVNVIPYVLG